MLFDVFKCEFKTLNYTANLQMQFICEILAPELADFRAREIFWFLCLEHKKLSKTQNI